MNRKKITIGPLLRYHRKQAGLTQNELARLSDVGKTVIFDLEKGKSTVRFDTLQRVLHALNITISFQGPLMDQYLKESRAKS